MMKKRLILFALALTLLLCGCGEVQTQMRYIGADAAKQLALENCGLSADAVDSMAADLCTRDGVDYYQIEITAAGEYYHCDIDALSGVVIASETPASPAPDIPAEDGNTAPEPAALPALPTDDGQSAASPAASLLTADEAKEKALTHAGLTSDQVTFAKSKLDNEHGRQVYEVEFYVTDSYAEYEYEIDAATGQVLSFDYDGKDDKGTASSGGMITADQARELALAQVPGAADSDIQYLKTEHDDGRIEYEGKIVYNNMVYEFEIDAYSGAFRSWEAEPIGH